MLDNPRAACKNQLRSTIPFSEWSANIKFIEELKTSLNTHSINKHPFIQKLNKSRVSHDKMKYIHLEYRHAIVQIFTDALLMLQYKAKDLEPRFSPGTKITPRFLVTLNILDEFGFSPGFDKEGYYQGNPIYAHYPLFEKLLNDYGISDQERESYQPSDIANQVKEFLEKSYNDYLSIVALLATAELEVMLFSPPLMRNTKSLGLDTTQGYYYCHGSSEEVDSDASDDDHADDLWFLLTHAIQPKDYTRIKKSCLDYCDLWVSFWNQFIENQNNFYVSTNK